ncbi:4-(cytidine 5'-diphospho)-2-C-methyl-D-erythritol kinase [Desulfofalx alkaliphila]|uniref:4-(cytidine 5'-diphospho)-2-C-methyl-D-erythritol kinase n=1 Tax=Desulfofalx alkaliphila TaxID=105483 RepID=UPI0004E106FA|nr:4-(cytidine 5'-diphospho)-2-C-methyl-D-erythritol kinase [Desulfofalx alkaliphila]
MEVIRAKACAKINLTLKVLGKRNDGYHQVEMIMQSLKLHDEMVFYPGGAGIELAVEGAVPPGEDNIVYQAARLLMQYSGRQRGASITLKKNIPVAAGLAGGSADAAATLLALNKLWDLKLTDKELFMLAAKLGSDIPFCLMGGTALAGGRGEELTKLSPAPEMGVVLVKPPFGVSTAQIYGEYDASKAAEDFGAVTESMINAINKRDVYAIARHLTNDLEQVTLKKYPLLKEIKERLIRAGALGVLMSGSGPTIYGLTADLESARGVANNIKHLDAELIVTTTA